MNTGHRLRGVRPAPGRTHGGRRPHGVIRRVAVAAVLVAVAGGGIVFAPVAPPPAHSDSIRNQEYWLDDYGFTEAWNTSKGAGVTVAVIDTGVAADIPALDGAVIGGTDVSGIGSPDGRTPIGSDSKHGTMVASLLGARGTGEDSGMIGVAPEVSILSVSVALGEGSVGTDEQIAQAVRWSVDNGADVINMSLTRNSLEWPASWDDAFQYAFDHDVVVVAAAGNRGSGTTEVAAPATIPGVMAVAGVDKSGNASFDASSQGITIAVAAPSEQLLGITPGDNYVTWAGTSGATPIVSGLVALVRSAHPDLDAASVINRVLATAVPKGEPVPGPLYGYGLISAAPAVTASVPPVAVNPLGDLSEWVKTYRPDTSSGIIGPQPIAAPTITADRPPVPFASSLWPSIAKLTLYGIPIAVISVFTVLFGLVVAAGVVHFRRAARRE